MGGRGLLGAGGSDHTETGAWLMGKPYGDLGFQPGYTFHHPLGPWRWPGHDLELSFVPSLLPVKVPWGNLSLEIYVCNECIFPES